MSVEQSMSDGGMRLREAQQQVANLELSLVQVRGEAQALRAEMETQRNRATQLEQLFQQQVSHPANSFIYYTSTYSPANGLQMACKSDTAHRGLLHVVSLLRAQSCTAHSRGCALPLKHLARGAALFCRAWLAG